MKTIGSILILVVLSCWLTNCLGAIKVQKPYVSLNDERSIKIVNYAIKKDNRLELKSVGVKNLQIKGFDDWVGVGIWTRDTYNKTGWALLEVETNEKSDDFHQAFAAGFLEGNLTREFISLHLINTVGDYCKNDSGILHLANEPNKKNQKSMGPSCVKIMNFLTDNLKWIDSQISLYPDDPYWHQVNLVFTQFYGLYHGYYGYEVDLSLVNRPIEHIVSDIRPFMDLFILQLNGDLSELLASLYKLSDPFIAGSCSALIKLLPNNQELFTSHVTWTNYESMLRIAKHFKLNYHMNIIDPTVIPGSEVSFSSYPGILVSIDDFYVLNTRLVVLETTIGNSNVDLWKYVTTDTNLYWVRNLVANRLSFTGVDWVKLFSMHNSGTYNNEWMVVDYKQFYPGEEPKENLLVVLEQLPGQVVWSDKTDVLKSQSYWPSYNLPYYPDVYNISGTFDAFKKYGSFFSYEDSPRANIFRRDHSKVKDVNSMIQMMRYNNFTKDPLSKCECHPPYSGENTIAARSDLNPSWGKYPFDALGHRDHGATDMKMTSWHMARNNEFIGVSGPTFDNEDITPFIWSKADFGNTTNHYGHPDVWVFSPVYIKWRL